MREYISFRERITLLVGFCITIMMLTNCNDLAGSEDGSENDSNNENSEEQADHPFAGGEGTEGSPYEIETFTQLDSVRHYLKSNFVLISDIDTGESDAQGFNPIGDFSTISDTLVSFEGTLDGNGHTISNLTIDFTYEEGKEFAAGVFNGLNGGSVKNITFENLSVQIDVASSTTPAKFFAGGLVGRIMDDTKVENVTIKGSIEASDLSKIGGLAGSNSGTVINSKVEGEVQGNYTIGGLVGVNRGSISDSNADARVKGNNDYIGGLVGRNFGSISASSASGKVTGTNRIGGFAGWLQDGKVINAEAIGNVEGEEVVGGLVGFNSRADIKDSNAKGDVSGTEGVGGLVGDTQSETSITNSVATGSVQGDRMVGGLAGYSSSQEIVNTSAEGKVTAEGKYIGGLIGFFDNGGSISESSAKGDVSGNRQVGGLTGNTTAGTITKSFAIGNVNGQYQVGGLVGLSRQAQVSESYATGSVSGNTNIGGLIGWQLEESIIEKSYARGDVSGSFKCGGIAGYARENVEIRNSYSVGEVVASSRDTESGGLIGSLENAVLTKSYWDMNTSTQQEGVGNINGSGETVTDIAGLSTSEMSGASAESNMSILDFENTWVTTDSYPTLSWKEE